MLTEACAFVVVLRVFSTEGYQKGAGLLLVGKDGEIDRKLIAYLEEMPLPSGGWLALKPQLFSSFLTHDSNKNWGEPHWVAPL